MDERKIKGGLRLLSDEIHELGLKFGIWFEPGMLYYSPQIWCSDDTDGVERLSIQEGTQLLYPLSAIGAHVSDCPNHATGRNTPFDTRAKVAMAGTFGYELDITEIPEADRKEISSQIALYKKYGSLIREGDYYRLASYRENHLYDCIEVVSKDKKTALLTYVQVLAEPNMPSRRILLQVNRMTEFLCRPEVIIWILIIIVYALSKFDFGLGYLSVTDIIRHHVDCFRNTNSKKLMIVPVVDYIVVPFMLGDVVDW